MSFPDKNTFLGGTERQTYKTSCCAEHIG